VLRDAATTRNFWILFFTFFICGASTNGLIGAHLIPAAHDHGIPETRAASLLALMGLCDLVGTTAAGWMSDRWDSRYLLGAYYGLRGLSLLFLPFALAGTSPSLFAFAVWYGLDWIATVPPTLRLANEAFGRTRAPIVFGWIGGGHQLGAASIAMIAGALRVSTGRYDWAFFGSGRSASGRRRWRSPSAADGRRKHRTACPSPRRFVPRRIVSSRNAGTSATRAQM